MGEFDSIRPYRDDEVSAVLARLSQDPTLLGLLIRFRFPRLAGSFGWLLRPLLAYRLRRECAGIDCVAKLQDKVEPYVDRTIEKATDGVTYSGLEKIPTGKACLFIANHRDIVMDPAFVNYALYHSEHSTLRIAIGDNLLQKPFVGDLMRLNKSFIVPRSITGRREKLAAFQQLSAYINHSIHNDQESVWIAQAEGRAKDGCDRTDPAILKMLHMSRKDQPFAEVISQLHVIPVSISYEYDPCDQAKARELSILASTGNYEKAQGEDDTSIGLGITGYKGRVHLHFGDEMSGEYKDARLMAVAIDQVILAHYRLFPVHYLAYAQWADQDAEIQVPSIVELFSADDLRRAEGEWQRRLDNCPAEYRPSLIMQYANPVRSHYRIKAGLPL